MTDEMVKSLQTRAIAPSDEETQINLQSRPHGTDTDGESNVAIGDDAE